MKLKQWIKMIKDKQEQTNHMVRLSLDAQKLTVLGKMLHLPLRITGTPYLVHCAISELFQDHAPKPFFVENDIKKTSSKNSNGRFVTILGYSELDLEGLKKVAQGFASPTVYSICHWDRSDSKPMPQTFPDGLELKFELRACPVVRKASDGPKWKEGQEIDAFLSKVWEIDDKSVPVDREETYKEWLIHYFKRQNSADLTSLSVTRFSIERMSRRNHKSNRKVKVIQRPDVTFTGTLKIRNGDEFKAMLYRGIGRHKSFGFGMLKIRRIN